MGWNAQEQYCEIATVAGPTSRIYARGLKASEDAARYVKFAGLTLAGVYVDQPEEIPYDFYTALKARLSQPGYPHQMLLTPNPPHHDHWLAKEFPEDNAHPDHRYIRTTVYDNRAAFGEAYNHAQNCLEYIVLAFGPTAERKPKRSGYEPPRMYQGPHGWMA